MNRPVRKKQPQRKGKPFTLYLALEQASQLDAVSRERNVSKATFVRLAVGRLLAQINSGQLELPLGIQ